MFGLLSDFSLSSKLSPVSSSSIASAENGFIATTGGTGTGSSRDGYVKSTLGVGRGGKQEKNLKSQNQSNPRVPYQDLDLPRTMLSQTYLNGLKMSSNYTHMVGVGVSSFILTRNSHCFTPAMLGWSYFSVCCVLGKTKEPVFIASF